MALRMKSDRFEIPDIASDSASSTLKVMTSAFGFPLLIYAFRITL
jgi:hypothetical protein